MSDRLPPYADVVERVVTLQLGVDAAELHGALVGLLCGRGRVSTWLAEVLADPQQPAPASGDVLARLESDTAAQLASDEFDLELLLPDDDAPLAERGEALSGWCRGFLGGLGLSQAMPQLGEEAREAVDDLAKIAGAELDYDDPESDEESFAEILEFVRVVAMLVHGDCQPPAEPPRRLH